jgi:hypothetical protein
MSHDYDVDEKFRSLAALDVLTHASLQLGAVFSTMVYIKQ